MTDSKPILYKNNKFELLNNDSDLENDDLKPVNNIVKNIEENMFKQYYSKKNNLKFNKSKINNDEYVTINVQKKKDKNIIEYNEIDVDDNLYDLNLPNNYRILAHHNDDKNWDYLSYHNITTLTKWADVSKFFNTLNKASGECKYTDFSIYIMKNEISPIWEDLENRNGSYCSIKIDSITDGYTLLKNLSYNMINNTLLKFSPNLCDIINGLSFSPKKIDNFNLDSYCVIIKIWFKINILNFGNIDKLFNNTIGDTISKYSIKVKAIKPEY